MIYCSNYKWNEDDYVYLKKKIRKEIKFIISHIQFKFIFPFTLNVNNRIS